MNDMKAPQPDAPLECPARKALADLMIRFQGIFDVYVDDDLNLSLITAREALSVPCPKCPKCADSWAEAEARLKQFLTQVEIHNRNTREWEAALNKAEAERDSLRERVKALEEGLTRLATSKFTDGWSRKITVALLADGKQAQR